MKPIIRVENLGKQYRIGRREAAYATLRESLVGAARAPFDCLRHGFRRELNVDAASDRFWALRDVSFEVTPGQVVGIIGRNGAGKSTLLKILSRVTEPTEGCVDLYGRVGSLLEVGTGFHPELTGRENIFLNGAILGMKRQEIRKNLDSIVSFAEISRFLDTPVKRYSSGMYVRLAFAVAAHLETNVLVVDEVLAVGDAAYQRRCIDRMAALADSGRTIIFVSHNMDIIPRLCARAILLESGRVGRIGPADEVVRYYLDRQSSSDLGENVSQVPRRGNGHARFTCLRLLHPLGGLAQAHRFGDDLDLEMRIASKCNLEDVDLAVVIHNLAGTRIASSWTRELGQLVAIREGDQVIRCVFRDVRLRPGHRVVIGLWMADSEVLDSIESAMTIDVVDGDSSHHLSNDKNQGIVVFPSEWQCLESPAAVSPHTRPPAAQARDPEVTLDD